MRKCLSKTAVYNRHVILRLYTAHNILLNNGHSMADRETELLAVIRRIGVALSAGNCRDLF
jgi:hypothetical protein